MSGFDTPVLLLAFNRPAETAKVIEAIRRIEPTNIYVALDGARKENETDVENCRQVKEIIEREINWKCSINKLFRQENLGCGKAVSQAINWFFEHIEEGIILEDDCVPNETFFNFCKSMLERYRNNNKIFAISGQNLQSGKVRGNGGYYFSRYLFIWGWATWRRAWQQYDFDMKDWPEFRENHLHKLLNNDINKVSYWADVLNSFYRKQVDSWDYQFLFAIWKNAGLTIVPNKNLVSNIGFGTDATHTKDVNSKLKSLPVYKMYSYKPPSIISANTKADNYFFYSVLLSRPPVSFLRIALNKLKKIKAVFCRSYAADL